MGVSSGGATTRHAILTFSEHECASLSLCLTLSSDVPHGAESETRSIVSAVAESSRV